MKKLNIKLIGIWILALAFGIQTVNAQDVTIQTDKDGERTVTIITKTIDSDGVEIIEKTILEGKEAESYQLGDISDREITILDSEKEVRVFEYDDAHFDNNVLENFIFNFSKNKQSCNSKKPFLGVVMEERDNVNGLYIESVIRASAAEKAGLQKGDVITSIDGVSVNDINQAIDAIQANEIGEAITISYTRHGTAMNTSAALGTQNNKRNFQRHQGSFLFDDYKRKPCDVFLGVYTSVTKSFSSSDGIKVDGVIENTPAFEAGILKGDLILLLDGNTTDSHDELVAERDKHQAGDEFTITYMRNGQTFTVDAKFKSCDQDQTATTPEVIEKEDPVVEMPAINSNNGLDIDLRAFPNPTSSKVQVRFEGDQVPTTVTVTDITGKEIFRDEVTNFSGFYDKKVNLLKAAPGTVIISVRQGDQVYSEKILYIVDRA